MKVLHVVTSLAGGGAERFVAQLAPEISRRGVRTSIMTVCPSPVPENVAASDVELLPIARKSRYDGGFVPRMVSAMRAWRPDVVHTHMHHGTYWGRLAAILAGVPTIVRTEHLPCDPHARAQGTGIADRFLNAATAAIVTFFQTQGEYLARYEGFSPAKLAAIPNGIAHGPVPGESARIEARNRLGVAPDVFCIVVLGNLHRHKNQRLAIEALASMDPGRRAFSRLVFIGDGADRPMLEQLARDSNVAQNVAFLGFRKDVDELLPGADVVLMPSLTEGMPLALLEAMSAAIPIVSTPWIGAAEMLARGEHGIISASWSPADLARDVERVFDDGGMFRERARSTQRFVRATYDIGVTAERHLNLYDAFAARATA